MTNKEIIKRQIIYRSIHRGTKEMDILLGSFVKKYINKFNDKDLKDLEKLLLKDDDQIFTWYFKKKSKIYFEKNNVTLLLKKFKL